MRTEFKRSLNRSYLVLYDARAETGYEWKMLENNRIPGLLSVERRFLNGTASAWYDISGTQSLDRYLETEPPDTRFFRLLLGGLKRMGELLPSYLLVQQDLLLDPELIFIRNDGSDICFCYHPMEEKDPFVALRELMELLLQRVDHRDEEAVRCAYAIYQITIEGEYDLDMLLEETKERRSVNMRQCEPEEEEERKPRVIYGMEDYKEKQKRRLPFHISKRNRDPAPEKEKEDLPVYMEERTMPDEKTTYLTMEEGKPRGELRYLGHGTERDRKLDTFPFLIGTREGLPGQMDSQAVSRQHARITKTEEDYYLEDLNSTNGTFKNDEPLNYRAKVRLLPNDHIRFADEEFLFL